MKKIAVLSLFALSAFAAEWTGTISDAGCGAKHAAASEKDMKCVQGCVKGKGAAPVFVVGDKVLKFDEASKAKVMDHLGHKVTITGKLDGETITVESVKM
jgi:hypothetical protein